MFLIELNSNINILKGRGNTHGSVKEFTNFGDSAFRYTYIFFFKMPKHHNIQF